MPVKHCLVLVGVISSLVANIYGQENSIPEKHLQIIRTIPNGIDTAIYFSWSRSLTIDQNNNIYVADYRGHKIFKFNFNGKLLKKIGRHGQGPAEFFYITSIDCRQEKLTVADKGNQRVQFLDQEGEYLDSFREMNIPSFLICFNDVVYGTIIKRTADYKNSFIAYNVDGRKLFEFGGLLPFGNNFLHLSCIDEYMGEIYTINRYFPFFSIYDKKGTLILNTNFDQMDYKRRAKFNYDPRNHNIINSKYNVYDIFMGLDVNEHGIFIGSIEKPSKGNGVIIDHFSFDMALLQRYKCQEINRMTDMKILVSQTNKFCIILGSNKEMEQKVFVTKL